ncbi:hypothetical protein WJW34_13930 [Vibrio diabolicus]
MSVPSNIAEGFQEKPRKKKRGFFITLKAL